jgi:hypothetical protein
MPTSFREALACATGLFAVREAATKLSVSIVKDTAAYLTCHY